MTERDGHTFETQPVDSSWHGHEGERSLRITWLRRVDGEDSLVERSYADLSQARVEDEAGQAGLELVDAITLRGNNGFLDQVALRFIVRA